MKSALSYIFSFIISLLLIFSLIGSVGCITAGNFATKKNLLELAEINELNSVAYKELNKYFTEKYAETGIPADVYMSSLSEDYLGQVIEDKINYGFTVLETGDAVYSGIPANADLEKSITSFFENYASETGYNISDENDPYYSKLATAKKQASAAIEEYCDVFKFNALVKHGIIQKVKPLYTKLPIITIICLGVSAFLILLLLVCNFKRVRDSVYWIASAAVSAGILGCIPCVYMLNTDYFSAFTIKQAQIYTAYTSAMKLFTQNILTGCVCLVIAAIVLYAVYSVFSAMSRKDRESASKKENSSAESA